MRSQLTTFFKIIQPMFQSKKRFQNYKRRFTNRLRRMRYNRYIYDWTEGVYVNQCLYVIHLSNKNKVRTALREEKLLEKMDEARKLYRRNKRS